MNRRVSASHLLLFLPLRDLRLLEQQSDAPQSRSGTDLLLLSAHVVMTLLPAETRSVTDSLVSVNANGKL